MLRIKVPASTANLGSGFDCLGLALNIYNEFEVSLSDHDELENDDPRFNNPDNLFLQAYHKGCGILNVQDHVHAIIHADIPVSRGLGSSAAMIVGGLCAAGVLHDDALTDEQIFLLAGEMEGHPDNAAPCVYGGLTASGIYAGQYCTHSLELHPGWHFTVFIPDFEVSTAYARKIMPASYPGNIAAESISHAIWESEALRTGSVPLLKAGCQDLLHEPYRRRLIKGYNSLKKIAEEKGDGILLISGSGSTCILISKTGLSFSQQERIKNLKEAVWEIREVKPSRGPEVWGDSQ